MNLKQNLKRLIDLQGITVAKLSRETEVPQSTISDWLTGSSPKKIEQIKKVASFFSKTVDELCFNESRELADCTSESHLSEYQDEINAGVFEVVLRRVKR